MDNDTQPGPHSMIILQLAAAVSVGAAFARAGVAWEALLLVWVGVLAVPLIAAWIASWSRVAMPWAVGIVGAACAAFLLSIGYDNSEMGMAWEVIGRVVLLIPMMAIGVTGVLVGYALGRGRSASS